MEYWSDSYLTEILNRLTFTITEIPSWKLEKIKDDKARGWSTKNVGKVGIGCVTCF